MDKGLFFLILSFVCVWVIIDEFGGHNYISKLISTLGPFFSSTPQDFSQRRAENVAEKSSEFLNSDKTNPKPFMESVKDRLLNKNTANDYIGLPTDGIKTGEQKINDMYADAKKGIAEANAHG